MQVLCIFLSPFCSFLFSFSFTYLFHFFSTLSVVALRFPYFFNSYHFWFIFYKLRFFLTINAWSPRCSFLASVNFLSTFQLLLSHGANHKKLGFFTFSYSGTLWWFCLFFLAVLSESVVAFCASEKLCWGFFQPSNLDRPCVGKSVSTPRAFYPNRRQSPQLLLSLPYYR